MVRDQFLWCVFPAQSSSDIVMANSPSPRPSRESGTEISVVSSYSLVPGSGNPVVAFRIGGRDVALVQSEVWTHEKYSTKTHHSIVSAGISRITSPLVMLIGCCRSVGP